MQSYRKQNLNSAQNKHVEKAKNQKKKKGKSINKWPTTEGKMKTGAGGDCWQFASVVYLCANNKHWHRAGTQRWLDN